MDSALTVSGTLGCGLLESAMVTDRPVEFVKRQLAISIGVVNQILQLFGTKGKNQYLSHL